MWMKCNNFGDALNPILYKYITGIDPMYCKLGAKSPSYMCIGSILNEATENTIVWGAGIAVPSQINKNIDVRAVRGPMTRQYLLNNNIDCPEIYGDPALLLPKYYNPTVTKKYKLGVIPHVIEYPHINISDPEILKIDLNLIHSYGIPSKWIKLSNVIRGGDYNVT